MILINKKQTNLKGDLNQRDIVGDGGQRREELTLRGELQVQISLKSKWSGWWSWS